MNESTPSYFFTFVSHQYSVVKVSKKSLNINGFKDFVYTFWASVNGTWVACVYNYWVSVYKTGLCVYTFGVPQYLG